MGAARRDRVASRASRLRERSVAVRPAAWVTVASAETNGVTGRITTNSGGTATAEVAAICLK
jgi:hypothetical protein